MRELHFVHYAVCILRNEINNVANVDEFLRLDDPSQVTHMHVCRICRELRWRFEIETGYLVPRIQFDCRLRLRERERPSTAVPRKCVRRYFEFQQGGNVICPSPLFFNQRTRPDQGQSFRTHVRACNCRYGHIGELLSSRSWPTWSWRGDRSKN